MTRYDIFLQTDIEEAKAQEIAKLQTSVQAMGNKIDETNSLLAKERKALRQALEEAPPVVKETQVLVEDTEKINSLKVEVENFKVWTYFLCPIKHTVKVAFKL